MKLRNNVVALMCVLGLVAGSVYAATEAAEPAPKQKVHHRKHHKVKRQHVVAHHDYKDMGSLPVEPVAACSVSHDEMVLAAATQNIGRSLSNKCDQGWFDRIRVSGGVNLDLGKFGNRSTTYMGENYQRFSINDAYLNVSANVTDWVKVFASLNANTATMSPTADTPEYSSVYATNSSLQLEQAFVTIGNFEASPVYAQMGKQFQDFSRYEIHPIVRSMTQVMSETLASSLKVGFISNGFNGSVYAFDTGIKKVNQSNAETNYGVSLGYEQVSDQLGFDLGIGYLNNLIGVNDVAYSTGFYSPTGYHTRVGATAIYADVNSGPFTIGARYTAALDNFNALDLPKDGLSSTRGAKPWAAGIQAGYAFEALGKNQNVYIGYQSSNDAAGLPLPKSRLLVGYNMEAFKNTTVGFEWDMDRAYSAPSMFTKRGTTSTFTIRSTVKFS